MGSDHYRFQAPVCRRLERRQTNRGGDEVHDPRSGSGSGPGLVLERLLEANPRYRANPGAIRGGEVIEIPEQAMCRG